ncbi:aminopeptidase [Thermaerobacillus caldiproteolyticus]|uniref:Aminopeptidase n=1 Tax=Thermaerobacillus caldiproteolyticus TaxID=247480 RepID=A0A7V9Z4D5_9BACL|nr:aminopeptidase [Anoxybacillus caldiproteolyticus]MBA2873842.1 aminopeptidase [Anoxybacillus caldiproteolyticus]QPA30395.1 aminopeptidase [Anoxybacillus caldiproteolyticus]
MKDPRIEQLAKTLIHYSVRLQKGEKVLIENFGLQRELVIALVREAYAAGGYPFVLLKDHQVDRALLLGAQEEQFEMMAEFEANVMKNMDAYIGLRAGDNINEFADVPDDKMKIHGKTIMQKVHREIRVPKTKWVVLRYPNPSMAQLAKMSTEAFEDFYFNVCNLDYSKMDKAMDALVALMEKTDKVRITGPGTDLTFSIKGIPAIKCSGQMNIPDGEVYTAPVRDSVNGTITFNTPSPYQGFTFENVKLTFKDGKIVEATANDTERINKIFDTDEGARYIGEFAIGVNPYIQHPMQDILFDEKIDGSFHFTPGQCYDEAYNGNHSNIHWDMVMIQRPEYGGGEIYFDDVLIRKDGRFVIPELEPLNPENLK